MTPIVVSDADHVVCLSNLQVQTALGDIFATERKGYEVVVQRLTNNQQKILRTLASVDGAQLQSKAFLAASGISLSASVNEP